MNISRPPSCHGIALSLALSFITSLSHAATADSLSSWVAQGEPHLLFNPRYEYGKIDGFEASHAATLKTLLGYTTANWRGLTASLEFSDTRALDEDAYNAAGLNGQPEKTVIADPETTELNQFYIRYEDESRSGTLGRQRYILDNARFIGNVGWRQNEQTFDALTFALTPTDKLILNAGYLHHINRIFGDEQDWDSESFLLNGSYALSPAAKFTAYYYHLDFEEAIVTTDTAGAFVAGSLTSARAVDWNYRLEAAFQSRENSPVETTYFHGFLGARYAAVRLSAGYEVLGSDNAAGQFLTPLATAHAFNGFADTYLDNGGPGGLRDLYFSVGGDIEKLNLTAVYHLFEGDEDDEADGRELDFVASYPVTRSFRALAKLALYDGDIRADRERFIVQLTASF